MHAEMISEVPTLTDPIVIGHNEDSIQFQIEWNELSVQDLDHYEVNVVVSEKTVAQVLVSSLYNKTIISTKHTSGTISVIAVTKCNFRSQSSKKSFKAGEISGSSKSKSFVIYLVAALAVIFCIISVLLLIVILAFVIQKLKINRVSYHKQINTC